MIRVLGLLACGAVLGVVGSYLALVVYFARNRFD